MAKVKRPKKEFWESKDKPKHLEIDRKIEEADEKPYKVSLKLRKSKREQKIRSN